MWGALFSLVDKAGRQGVNAYVSDGSKLSGASFTPFFEVGFGMCTRSKPS